MFRATALAVLAACSFHPPGATTDGSTGGDGTAGDDAPSETARCGSPGAVRDDFEASTIANQWSPDSGGGNLALLNGRFEVTPLSGRFAGVRAKHYVNLTGAAVEVEVPQMLDTTERGIAELILEADTTHRLVFAQTMGNLGAQVVDGGQSQGTSVPYDPAQHRFWRIAEAGGSVAFETSPDGSAWTRVYSQATPSFATSVRIALGTTLGSGSSTGVSFGTVAFDNLDIAVPVVPWCKADTLHDLFQRSTIGAEWANSEVPDTIACGLYIQDGAHADQHGAPTECYFGSAAAYNLVDSTVVVRVDAIATFTAGWSTFVEAVADDGTALRLAFDNNQLCAKAGTLALCRTYDANEIYWRIGAANGMVNFDSSPDQQSWNAVLSTPAPFAPSAVELRFGTASTVDLTVDPIGLTFGSYN